MILIFRRSIDFQQENTFTPQGSLAWLAFALIAAGWILAQVGVSIVNLSILKNGRAKAIRFSTLTRLCDALGCQPGNLLSWRKED